MPSQRKAGKRMVGFYATEEEAAAMMEAAKRNNMTLADWLRSLIPDDNPKLQLPKSKSNASEKRAKKAD